jgi:hypothetical protein
MTAAPLGVSLASQCGQKSTPPLVPNLAFRFNLRPWLLANLLSHGDGIDLVSVQARPHGLTGPIMLLRKIFMCIFVTCIVCLIAAWPLLRLIQGALNHGVLLPTLAASVIFTHYVHLSSHGTAYFKSAYLYGCIDSWLGVLVA